MTTMSSMKFRTENDMSLSSTTQGLENHENPLGFPKAEDGSSRPRCRGPQGHRLKPAKTKPASKAVLFGPPSITKCMYLLMICTFSALMVSMYGGKEKISQHRRLPATKYNNYEAFDTLKSKFDGRDVGKDNKWIVGHFNEGMKPEEIAEPFREKLHKWWENASDLSKCASTIHRKCTKLTKKGKKTNESYPYKTHLEFQDAIAPYIRASEHLQKFIDRARKEKPCPTNDFELMKSILCQWFTISTHQLGNKDVVREGTAEIVDNLLLRQIRRLSETDFTEKSKGKLGHSIFWYKNLNKILEACTITRNIVTKRKLNDSRCIEYLTQIFDDMPGFSPLLEQAMAANYTPIITSNYYKRSGSLYRWKEGSELLVWDLKHGWCNGVITSMLSDTEVAVTYTLHTGEVVSVDRIPIRDGRRLRHFLPFISGDSTQKQCGDTDEKTAEETES